MGWGGGALIWGISWFLCCECFRGRPQAMDDISRRETPTGRRCAPTGRHPHPHPCRFPVRPPDSRFCLAPTTVLALADCLSAFGWAHSRRGLVGESPGGCAGRTLGPCDPHGCCSCVYVGRGWVAAGLPGCPHTGGPRWGLVTRALVSQGLPCPGSVGPLVRPQAAEDDLGDAVDHRPQLGCHVASPGLGLWCWFQAGPRRTCPSGDLMQVWSRALNQADRRWEV